MLSNLPPNNFATLLQKQVIRGKFCVDALKYKPLCLTLSITEMTKEEIKAISDRMAAQTLICTKEVLTSEEAALYMGVSKSYLYKLTMRGEIPHFKPLGKKCYFNRKELEEWLQQNRCATQTELSDNANRFCMKGGR